MNKGMDQNEIDALFAAPPSMPDDAAKAAERERLKRSVYNFSRAGQISNEQMKAISTVNDLFARNLTHRLGAWLRTQFQVTLAAGEQMVYVEFLERIPQLSYVCSVGLEPLDTIGVLELDLTLAPPIVDLLLGGVGRAGELREPTDIEDQILLAVMEIVVHELNIAWQSAGMQFSLEKRELEAQIPRLMVHGEKILCVSFEICMPQAQGALHLCLPAVVLNTILRKVSTERDRPRRRSPESRSRLTELMGEAKFGAVMQLPKMRLRAEELANMAVGSVLRLPLPRHANGELRIGGLPIFVAHAARSGEHRAAQIQSHAIATERMGF